MLSHHLAKLRMEDMKAQTREEKKGTNWAEYIIG